MYTLRTLGVIIFDIMNNNITFLLIFLFLNISSTGCSKKIFKEDLSSKNCEIELKVLGEIFGNDSQHVHIVYGSKDTIGGNSTQELTELIYKISNISNVKYENVDVSIKYKINDGFIAHDSLVQINDSFKEYMSRDIKNLKTVNYRFEYLSKSFGIYFLDKLVFTSSSKIQDFNMENIDTIEILISLNNQPCKSIELSFCRLKASNENQLINTYLSKLKNHYSPDLLDSLKVIFNYNSQIEWKGHMHDIITFDNRKTYVYQNELKSFVQVN